MQFQIKVHVPGRTYPDYHFFILSRGNNAGKPLDQACPNCFVIASPSGDEIQFLYWLCYGLWQCKLFHPYLSGSVIPFIRIGELRTVINQAYQRVNSNRSSWLKTIKSVNQLLSRQQKLTIQLKLVHELKNLILIKHFK